MRIFGAIVLGILFAMQFGGMSFLVGIIVGLIFTPLIIRKLAYDSKFAKIPQEEHELYFIYKDLKNIIICFSIGGVLLIYSVMYATFQIYFGFVELCKVLPGLLIIGFPVLIPLLSAPGIMQNTNPDYEVVTTYADGHKESDKGAASATQKGLSNLLMAVPLLLFSIIFQTVKLITTSIKYSKACKEFGQKPSFKPSASALFKINGFILIAALFVFGSWRLGIFDPILDKTFSIESTAIGSPKATVNRNNAALYKGLTRNVGRRLKKGDVVYVVNSTPHDGKVYIVFGRSEGSIKIDALNMDTTP